MLCGSLNLKKILIAGEKDKTVNYEKAVEQLGAMPITTLNVPEVWIYDGLILPGGGDVDPKLFCQLPHGTRQFDPVLDRIQLAILSAFLIYKKPVLGICKGMQLINIYFGGDMVQDLPEADQHQYVEKDQIHGVMNTSGYLMEKLYGETCYVNSAHHQGVDIPGNGIVYTQCANDGVVEALQHKYLSIIGVQWHPERMCFDHKRDDTADGKILLEYFLKRT